jgi:ADP-ribosylation factor 2-binding protein
MVEANKKAQVIEAADMMQTGDGADFEDIVDGDTGHIDIGDEEEFFFEQSGQNEDDNQFDMIVGLLQEILLGEDFTSMIEKFAMSNCMHFEPTEENKLVYTDLFKKYCEMVEGHVITGIKEEVAGF